MLDSYPQVVSPICYFFFFNLCCFSPSLHLCFFTLAFSLTSALLLPLQVSQDVGYQVFATMATFYVPLIVILFLYWRIFVTARTRLRNRLAQKAKVPAAATNSRNQQQPVQSQVREHRRAYS